MSKEKEKKSAAASYILNFYREVLTLTSYHSQYLNLLLEIESKYKEIEKASEAEKLNIQQAIQNVRYYCTQVYIQYRSIANAIKLKENEKIEEIYTKLKTNYVLQRQDVEDYVILLNNLLVEEVIQDLLQSSEQIVKHAFNNDISE